MYTTVNSFDCFSSPVACPANSANQSFQTHVTATAAVCFRQPESQPSLEELRSSISGAKEPIRAKTMVLLLCASEAQKHTPEYLEPYLQWSD